MMMLGPFDINEIVSHWPSLLIELYLLPCIIYIL